MQQPLYRIFLCDIINPLTDTECQYFKRGALATKRVGNNYKILEVGYEKDILPEYHGKRSIEVVELVGKTMLPPFFDMHFHWVQDDVCLMPKEDLLDWLSNFTWPNESKFQEVDYAESKANDFAQKLVAMGTFGGGCFASIHGHTVDLALEKFTGDFVVGNVLMSMNSPDYMTQSDGDAIELVAKKAKKYKKRYAMTPRFAITTGPELMKKGAQIAEEHDSFIQSHLSETPNEIEYVLSIYKELEGFEKVKTYTEIYDKCGVLGPKTIMGHGIYLSDEELKTLKKSKTIIAHCPTSNAPVEELGLGSGLFDFKRTEAAGVRWVLGSDIGGGPFLSMLDVMRSFVDQNSDKPEATYIKALYRATLAGAQALSVDSRVGNFASDKETNFLLVDNFEQEFEDANDFLGFLIRNNSRSNYSKIVKNAYYGGNEIYRLK